MDIVINERSFVGQARYYNVHDYVRRLADTVEALRPHCRDGQVLIHSSLVHQPLTDTQTLREWLFNEDYRRDDASPDDLRLQALIGVILASFTQGPFIDELMAATPHLCEYLGADAEGSALARAAGHAAMLVSLDGCLDYTDGPLEVAYCENDGTVDVEQRTIAHFIFDQTAHRCRRRYFPNPKHHPLRARGKVAAMLLDIEYDPLDDAKVVRLRDLSQPPLATEAQRLLDSAEVGGNQLYARTLDGRRVETFYEFQYDNDDGFHGYLVPESEVPARVVQSLRKRAG